MKPHHSLLAILLVIVCLNGRLHAQDAAATQAWTASDGRTIQAKFIKLDGESVVIEKDGKQFAVAFAKLNADSVAQAKKLGGVPVPAPAPAAAPTAAESKPTTAPAIANVLTKEALLGKWHCVSVSGWKGTYEFSADGKVVDTEDATKKVVVNQWQIEGDAVTWPHGKGKLKLQLGADGKLTGISGFGNKLVVERMQASGPSVAGTPSSGAPATTADAAEDDAEYPTWKMVYSGEKPFQAKFIKMEGEYIELKTKDKGSIRRASLGAFDDKSALQALRLAGLLPPAKDDAPAKPMIANGFDKPAAPPPLVSPTPAGDPTVWQPEGWTFKRATSRHHFIDDDGGIVMLVDTGDGNGLVKFSGTDCKPLWNLQPSALEVTGSAYLIAGKNQHAFVVAGVAGAAGGDIVATGISTKDGKQLWKQTYDGPQKGDDKLGYECQAVDAAGNLVVSITSSGPPQPPDPKRPNSRPMAPRGSSDALVLTFGAEDGKVREGQALAVAGKDDNVNEMHTDGSGRFYFNQQTEYSSYQFVCYDSAADKTLWTAPLPSRGSYAADVDAGGVLLRPAAFGSVPSFVNIAQFTPAGEQAWSQQFIEMSSKYPRALPVSKDIVCVAGANRVDGALMFRAYSRTNGKLLWQKDDLLSAAARVSKDNNRDYFDHVLLADKQGNVFLGWTQPRDNEYQPVLAKFSPKGDLLWLQQLAERTAPICAGLDSTMFLDDQGNPVFLFEQAEPGSKPSKGQLLSDSSITKKKVWSIAKFDGGSGKALWQYAHTGIVDEEQMIGLSSKLTFDKEGNIVFVWTLYQSPALSVLKLSAEDGKALWETKIGK